MSFLVSKKKPLSAKDQQQLINYAYDGNLQGVRKLLREGANVNAQQNDGTSALIMASWKGHVEVVKALLLHDKVDVNARRTTDGVTALWMASQNGHVEIVKVLLMNNKVDVNARRTIDGLTPLYMASQYGYTEIVRCLEGPSRNQQLIRAARDGNLQDVRHLLRMGANINAYDEDGDTSLIWASYKGHFAIVSFMLWTPAHGEVEVNVNHQNKYGNTALLLAIDRGHEDIVKLLLQHKKVDANLKNNDGDTALLFASVAGHTDTVMELLKKHRVDQDHRNEAKKTAVDLARDNRHGDIVFCLEAHPRNKRLIRAARDGDLKDVSDLLKQGANINAKVDNGETALIVASTNGHIDIVSQLLLKNEVDVNARGDTDGVTSLFIASQNGHVKVVEQLLKHKKVDVTLQDINGSTALDVARSKEHADVVRLLKEHTVLSVPTSETCTVDKS